MATTLAGSLMLQQKEYEDFCPRTDRVTLRRPDEGKNILLKINDETHEIGRIASAFPLSSAMENVAFFTTEGEEIGVMKKVERLDPESFRILREELEKAYFMPAILAVEDINEHLGVEEWEVRTDKGQRTFQVRDPRRNVRKIGENRILIKDVDGNRYEAKDWKRMDRTSFSYMMRYV
ncbi:MAG: DUF1854 domain-containing protein [Planctomycetes bacterium]|nr:DUF1854 domain-containing protein [Planctomycetota bacterium]